MGDAKTLEHSDDTECVRKTGSWRGVGLQAPFKFLTDAQSRFMAVAPDRILVNPQLAWHNKQCPCFSVVSEAKHKARLSAIEGRGVKSPSRVQAQDKGVAERNEREQC